MAATIADVVTGVLAKDYAVQRVAADVGSAANAELARLAQHPDDEVRQLAVHCLDVTGGPGAPEALVAALVDPEPMVAMAAARALHEQADPRVYPGLIAAFDRRPEPEILREIPLVIGRMAGKVPGDELRRRYEREAIPEAREGLMVGLARLGDPGARKDFVAALEASSGEARKRFLEHAEYLGQPWLLPALLPVLSDTSPLVRVGIDGRPDLIDTLRACDIAVGLVAKIAGVTFSFPVMRAKNYAPAELDEVRAHVRALPRP